MKRIILFFALLCFCTVSESRVYIAISYESLARETVKELMPLVEEAAGESFSFIPNIETARASVVGKIIAGENAGLMKKLGRFMTKNEKLFYEKSLASDPSRILAKYSPAKKTIYLLPDNFSSDPLWKRLTILQEKELFTLIVCHEMAHALSDQKYSLFGYMDQVRTVDESHSLNACIEGYAVFITKKVAKKIGYDKPEYRDFLEGRFEYSISKPEDMVFKMNAELMNFYYLGGAGFFERIYKTGGISAVKRILRSPPKDTDIIMHPEKLRHKKRKKTISLENIIEGLKEIPIFQDWDYVEKHYGSALFKSVLIAGGFSRADAEAVLKKYTNGAQSVWYKDDKCFTINVFAFQDRMAAQKFVDLDRKNVQMLSAGDMISLKSSGEITVKGADRAWKDEYQVSAFFKRDAYSIMGFAKDFLVVDVQCVNSPELYGHQDFTLGKIMSNITKQKQ